MKKNIWIELAWKEYQARKKGVGGMTEDEAMEKENERVHWSENDEIHYQHTIN